MANNEIIKNLVKLMRVWEWWDKLQIILAGILILISSEHSSKIFFFPLIFMSIYLPFISAYGYVINSYFDRDADESVNKQPAVKYFTKKQHLAIVLILGIPSILIPMVYQNLWISIVGLIIFLLATVYSAPPLRLKEKGIFGPISAGLVQRPLPFYLFTLLAPIDEKLALYLFGWLTLVGLSIMFGHQLLDYENDKKTGIKTFALQIGYSLSNKIAIISILFTCIYIFSAPLIFELVNGIALALVLTVFSGNSVMYVTYNIKDAKKEHKNLA